MCLLVEGVAGDPPIVVGESAVAELLGLIAVLRNEAVACRLSLAPASRVLLIGREEAADPEFYASVVGISAD